MPTGRKAYNIRGLVPQLLQGGIWILAETAASLGVLILLARVFGAGDIPSLVYLGVVLAVVGVGEASRLSIVVSQAFFASGWRLWARLLFGVRQFGERGGLISLLFALTTLAFVAATGTLVVLGLQSPRQVPPQPPYAQDLFVSVLTIVTAVVAVFFAGAALVVELILGAYTSQFVRAFLRHRVFSLSLVLMIAVAVANLLPLRFGWNELLATASLCSGMYVIVCLGLLVALLTRFLQIPVVVKDVSSGVLSYIRNNLPPPRPSVHDVLDQRRGPPFADRLVFALKFYVLGRLAGSRSPVVLPSGFSDGLQDRTRPIVSACLRAITQDRRDIALACLNSIVAIATLYLEKRRDYVLSDDPFSSFLVSQIEILFIAACEVENQQFTTDIVEAISSIGYASVRLRESELLNQRNRIATRCTASLAKLCLKSLPLSYTSAPIAACEGITRIGRGLLAEGTYNAALYGAVGDLKRIGEHTAAMAGVWTSAITQKAIHGLVLMLHDLLSLALTGSQHQEYATRGLCEAIQGIARVAFSHRRGLDDSMAISAPLVGTFWLEINLVDVFCYTLGALRDPSEASHYRLVPETLPMVKLVCRIGPMTLSSASSSDYCAALSAMTWCTIQLLVDQENPHLVREGGKLLRVLLQGVHNYTAEALEKRPDMLFNYLQQLSPSYAFLAYFARDKQNKLLISELSSAIERLSNLLREVPECKRDEPGYRRLYSYAKMYGAWLHKYFPRNSALEELVHTLAGTAPPEAEMPEYAFSKMERLGYSSMLGGERWYVFPSRYWFHSQQPITEELDDLENYEAFDRLVQEAKAH